MASDSVHVDWNLRFCLSYKLPMLLAPLDLVQCSCSQRVAPRPAPRSATPECRFRWGWWGCRFSYHQLTESERLGLGPSKLFHSKRSWDTDPASVRTTIIFSPWLSGIIVWLQGHHWKWRQQPVIDPCTSTYMWSRVKGISLIF